jgi:AraC-like DNA-binding protein
MKSETVPQVRAASLAPFIEIAQRIGVDPYAMLRKARIRPEELTDPETRLAAVAVAKLIDDTARIAGCDSLGLMMAESRGFATLGPISLLLQHRATMRGAVSSLIKHQRLLGDVADYVIEDDGEVASLRVEILPSLGLRHAVELSVAMLFRAYTQMSGGRWVPDSIHFRHSAPTSLQAHKRFFGCAVEFDSEFDGMSCRSSALDIPNPAGNEVMARHAEACLDILAGQRATASVADQVRRAINGLIARGAVTMESVADSLGLHPRMLQRLLEKEGATFAALLNETRHELAARYLAHSNHSVTDVGLLLGYSTLSSFSRWFTIEFGKSPAAWRNAERGLPAFGRAADGPQPLKIAAG